MEFSKYQLGIFDFIEHGTGNGVVDAVPGSGKTTTLVEAAPRIPRSANAAFVAFNRHIAEELKVKLATKGSSMQAMTLHSMGLKILNAFGNGKRLKVNEWKYKDLAKAYVEQFQDFLQDNDLEVWQVIAQLKKLVDMAQLNLALKGEDFYVEEPQSMIEAPDLANLKVYHDDRPAIRKKLNDEEKIAHLANHFDLDISPNDIQWNILWQGVYEVMQQGIDEAQETGKISYNDMIWLPVVKNLAHPTYDWMFIDEAQDLNPAQLELVLRSVKPTGRLLFVGDKRQSLYGFAGADTKSIDKIIERTHATVLPLSICYRCPKSHIDLCASIFPGIEAAPNASEGVIKHIIPERLWEEARPGDLVLCRTTAPLVKHCLELLRKGIRAKVRGRDIGQGFVDIVKKLQKAHPGLDITGLYDALEEYRSQQTEMIGRNERHAMKLESMNDKVDTIEVLIDGYSMSRSQHLDDFIAYIENLFSDELGSFVTFSTVHKAKGLEEKRVFILRPELMPFPKAKLGWQMEQEYNIKYVALSRSKKDLYFVDYETPELEKLINNYEPELAAEESDIEKQEELKPEIVVMLRAAAGAGRAFMDWDIDYTVGTGIIDNTTKCIWNKSGKRITASLIHGGGWIISESKEPDLLYPLLDRLFDEPVSKKGVR